MKSQNAKVEDFKEDEEEGPARGAKSTVVQNQNVAIKMPDGNKQDGEVASSKRTFQLAEKSARDCMRACIAEILGTFFLILICVGSANSRILTSLAPDTTTVNFPVTYYLTISFAFGLGIGGIVHILSPSSGGNVNPAVSLALFLDRRISLVRMVCYIISQFIGGFAGAGALYALGSHGELSSISGTNSYDSSYTSDGEAFAFEALGTMFLILTILATIHEKRGHAPSYLQPLAIGVAIFVIHIWLIPYTNCGINPVRGTVWNIVTGDASYKSLVFLFAPMVGSGLAVPLFHFIFKP